MTLLLSTISETIAFILLLYVGMLLLIQFCARKQLDHWGSSLDSWKEAHLEWNNARAELRRAGKDLAKAQRATLGAVHDLYNKEKVARETEVAAAGHLQIRRDEVNEAIGGVRASACSVIRPWLGQLGTKARSLPARTIHWVKKSWEFFGATINWVRRHQWFVGAMLSLIGIFNSYIYYSRFDFNLLPYLSDLTIDALIAVVLAATVATAVLLLAAFLLAVSSILLIQSIPPLVLIFLASTAVVVWGWVSCQALRLCGRSVRVSQLTVVLAKWLARFIVWAQEVWRKMRGAIGSLTKILFVKRTLRLLHATNTIRSAFSLLSAIGLIYIISIEPQYRAHIACRDDNRIEFVVQEVSEGTDNVMAKIGSNGNYLFATPVESCLAQPIGDMGAQSVVVAKDTVPQNLGRIGNSFCKSVGNWLCERWTFAWNNVFGKPGLSDAVAFLAISQPVDFGGPVVVLPTTRVRCMYNRGSPAEALPVCDVPNSRVTDNENEERLLREQLANSIEGCKRPVMSRPLVFMPNKWEEPIHKTELHIFQFITEHETELAERVGTKLYVFGFASADGAGEYNEQLAVNRAQTIGELVGQVAGSGADWAIETRSLGENHLTNRVADSRSARLVFCSEEGRES